jgi:nucleotide-binding universal stress UspA family protein
MTTKILVALDGSKTSEAVLPYLESLLHYQDADVTLATAVAPGPIPQMEAGGYLKEAADRLRRKGAVVDIEVLTGKPASALTAYAAGGRFDLLALCSRGKTGLKRMLFGSVAEEILRSTTVPVLVVPPADRRQAPEAVKKIVVPLDGSHRSAAVLKPAAALAKAFGAKLCFVTVVSPTAAEDLPVETVAHNLFQDQKALQKNGLEVEVAVLYGDPTDRILAFAEENQADLIALASHGRTGLDKVVFGTVAESLLRRSRRPLLVVRSAAVPKTAGKSAGALKAKHRALELISKIPAPAKSPYSKS